MIKIGIDIDDTISNTNQFLIDMAFKYDKLIGGKGFKDKDAYNFTDMFYWNDDKKKGYFKYLKENELLLKVQLRQDFKDVLKELNKVALIYFISARSQKSFKNPFNQTKKWLKENNVDYEQLYVDVLSKGEKAEELNIDLFIDDFASNCEDVINHGIDTLLMTSNYNKESKLKRVDNWYQILEYIRK